MSIELQWILRCSRTLFHILSFFVGSAEVSLFAQEVMKLERLSIRSEGSTLTAVDSKGETVSSKPSQKSDDQSAPAVMDIQQGTKVRVSGNSPAQLIISDAVTANLEAGTEIELPKIEKDQKAAVSLKLLKGKMFINIDPEKVIGVLLKVRSEYFPRARRELEPKIKFRLPTTKSVSLSTNGTIPLQNDGVISGIAQRGFPTVFIPSEINYLDSPANRTAIQAKPAAELFMDVV